MDVAQGKDPKDKSWCRSIFVGEFLAIIWQDSAGVAIRLLYASKLGFFLSSFHAESKGPTPLQHHLPHHCPLIRPGF